MSVEVSVSDNGDLQLTVDGVRYPPLPIEAAEALAREVPAAKVAAARTGLLVGLRALIDGIAPSGAGLEAQVTVGQGSVSAVLDDESFARAQQALGVSPGPDGVLRKGSMRVHRRPVEPEPEPEPAPPDVTPVVPPAEVEPVPEPPSEVLP